MSERKGVAERWGVDGVLVPVPAVTGVGRSRLEVSSGPALFALIVANGVLGETLNFEDLKTVGKVVCRNPLATLLRSKGKGGPSMSVIFSFIPFGEEKGPRKPA